MKKIKIHEQTIEVDKNFITWAPFYDLEYSIIEEDENDDDDHDMRNWKWPPTEENILF